MSEPAWYAEVRAAKAADRTLTLPALATRFRVSRTTIWDILHHRTRRKRRNNAKSMQMQSRWADPVWAAAQRERIQAGMLASPHMIGRPAGRGSPQQEAEAAREKPYDPMNNPRMQRLLGDSR